MVATSAPITVKQCTDLVHRYFVGDRRNLDKVRFDRQPDLDARLRRRHQAVEGGSGEHLTHRFENLHTFGDQQQNGVFILFPDTRRIGGAPCRKQLTRHLHSERLTFLIALDQRSLGCGIGFDDATQLLGCGDQLKYEVPISCHDFTGHSVQVTVQIIFNPAFRTDRIGDFLRHMQADAGVGERGKYGACEHGPVLFGDEYAVRIAYA